MNVTLPANFSWEDALNTPVGNAGTKTFNATFTPTVVTGIADVETGHAPSLRVWSSEGRLKIAADIAGTAYIYNISGVLVKTTAYLSGETNVTLSRGLYIVRTEGKTTKLLIK